MGLFSKIKEPIFMKPDSDAEKLLLALEELKSRASGQVLKEIEQEITNIKYGISGEKNIEFELKNSHYPMVVLHDLYFEKDGLSAQVDYVIVTKGYLFFIECKNLYGSITVDSKGEFVRTMKYGAHTVKKGLYSPITQNKRHIDLYKSIIMSESGKLKQLFVSSGFDATTLGLVVLANPETILNDKYVKKEIKNQIVRADNLIETIKQKNKSLDNSYFVSETKMVEWAERIKSRAIPNPADYTEKFRLMIEDQESEKKNQSDSDNTSESMTEIKSEEHKETTENETNISNEKIVNCPLCGAPMVKRVSKRGTHAGEVFYGCSNFPKCRGIAKAE